jgi:hypothetical protein
VTVDPPDERDVLTLARLLGLEDACQGDLTALTGELADLVTESNRHSMQDLGDDGPAVNFTPTQ